MRNFFVGALFVLFLVPETEAQVASRTQLVYGRVNRNVVSRDGTYRSPAANVKVLMMEMVNSFLNFDRNICNNRTYPSQVSVFTTDSKGEYNFKSMKRGAKYRLVICDTRTGRVYFTELQIPLSGNSGFKVPDQNIR